MDKLDFVKVIQDIFAECKTEEEIESKYRQMNLMLLHQELMSKKYLESGVL